MIQATRGAIHFTIHRAPSINSQKNKFTNATKLRHAEDVAFSVMLLAEIQFFMHQNTMSMATFRLVTEKYIMLDDAASLGNFI